MGILHNEQAKRLAKRLRRILRNDLGEETRLSHCQEVIAESFDFGSFSAMMHGLPADVVWHRDWCVNALHDAGHVSSKSIAEEGIDRLEAALGNLITGRSAPRPEDEPESLYR